MASPGASNWANCCIEIPKGGGKGGAAGGRRIALAGEDSAAGVKYRGWYQLKSQDKPGDVLQLHFRLDPSAPRNSVVQNVDFLTTEDREALIARQEMLMSQRLSTAPAASIPSCSTTTPATWPNEGNGHGSGGGGGSGSAPAAQARCDELLARLTTAADGKPMQLLQLRGSEVPRDVELYFCQRTFTVLQVRPKMKITSLLHDYGVEPQSIDASGKGGVYDFQCQRSAHHLEVKVQPPLGLQSLLSGTASSECAPRAGRLRLLTETLPALLALYHILAAFQQDPTRDKVPCREACEGVPHLSEKLAGDAPVLQAFLDKCQVFQRLEQAPAPTLLLVDASRPKSRGKLLKALFEVKMILMSSVQELQSDSGVLSDSEQNQLLQGLVADLTRRCCVGGLVEQHKDPEDSFKNLRLLFCGDSDGAAKEEARATLRQCQANCRNSVLPNLEKRGVLGDLREPNLEMNDSDSAVNYKHAYNRVWRAAVQTYLFSQVTSEDYEKGWQVGLRQIRFQWAKPDAALRRLQPSEKLEEAIEYWDSELELILADLSSKHGLNHLSNNNNNTATSVEPHAAASANPRASVGLDNPGENLCATNSLLQFLFSAENFRGAILDIPEANGSPPLKAPAQLYTTLEQESRQLATALNTLFAEMSDAKCSSTSAREVARVLYGGELGEQQDPDELMHRISSLLQDGLEAIPGDPFASLRKGFQRLFMGATYEVQVRREVADGTACDFRPIVRTLDNLHAIGFPADPTTSNKQFLCIPVQGRNETLTQALEDFTSWAPTGGSDVVWIQEQFRTMPPYLCFATRQVSQLEWEESLNLTRFATRATPEMQRDQYELSKLQQCKAELQDSIENLRRHSMTRGRCKTRIRDGTGPLSAVTAGHVALLAAALLGWQLSAASGFTLSTASHPRAPGVAAGLKSLPAAGIHSGPPFSLRPPGHGRVTGWQGLGCLLALCSWSCLHSHKKTARPAFMDPRVHCVHIQQGAKLCNRVTTPAVELAGVPTVRVASQSPAAPALSGAAELAGIFLTPAATSPLPGAEAATAAFTAPTAELRRIRRPNTASWTGHSRRSQRRAKTARNAHGTAGVGRAARRHVGAKVSATAMAVSIPPSYDPSCQTSRIQLGLRARSCLRIASSREAKTPAKSKDSSVGSHSSISMMEIDMEAARL